MLILSALMLTRLMSIMLYQVFKRQFMNFSDILIYIHQLSPAQRIKSLSKLQDIFLQMYSKAKNAVKLLYKFIMNDTELQKAYKKSFF